MRLQLKIAAIDKTATASIRDGSEPFDLKVIREENRYIAYPAEGNIDPNVGTIEMVVNKTDLAGDKKMLFDIQKDNNHNYYNDRLYIWYRSNRLQFYVRKSEAEFLRSQIKFIDTLAGENWLIRATIDTSNNAISMKIYDNSIGLLM